MAPERIADAVNSTPLEGVFHWLVGIVMSGLSAVGGWAFKRINEHGEQIAELKEITARLDERSKATNETVERIDEKMDRILDHMARGGRR